MKIKILAIVFLVFTAFILEAQSIKGIVKDEKGQPIVGAHVYWMDESVETLTNENGQFDLARKTKEGMIHIEFVGYERVMLTLKQGQTDVTVEMREPKQLNSVEITGRKGDNVVSALDARSVERISSNELRKAPCCNLSESFETNGTVDIQYADAITGAKEIQMLGLRGIYTQLMVENRPDFYGLAMPYALEYLPGTWLRGIDINKGVGSVKNGFQSITGQINAQLVQPAENAPIFINLFGESTGRLETNVHLNKVLTPNFAHQLLLHGSTFQNKLDHEKDGFVDMPLKQQLNGMYRAFYSGKTIESQFQFHALAEERKSGQLIDNQVIKHPFLIDVKNQRLSMGLKLGYIGFDKPYKGLGSQWSGTYHDVNALYGRNKYLGTQKSFLGNVIYSTIINTTDNKLTFGGSFQYDDYKEFLNEKNLSRTEGVAGAYSEYVYSRPTMKGYNDITIIAGLRGDFHNKYGFVATPRFNFKYNFNEGDVIRLTAGRGWRVANPIAENVSYLATNRQIIVSDDLKPEDAWNFGINAVKTFKLGEKREARLSFDAYRTQFTNQIIADIETDHNKALFYNLDGKSYANTFLTMLTVEIVRGLDVKLVYKLNDVKTTYKGVFEEVPLVAKHRGLVTLDYRTPNKKWMFNATNQIVGQQRLANRSYVPYEFGHQHAAYSPVYSLTNFSINRFFKQIEVYGGVENLFDYTQHSPIIAWKDPSSEYFDATQVYAPMMGRRIYAGLRLKIGEKK
jgi:outer membrane receptor for ferrienterochelin and colicins